MVALDISHANRRSRVSQPRIIPALPAESRPAAARKPSSPRRTGGPVVPQSVSGRFRRIKWTTLAICLGLFGLLPFLRWSRGPGEPDQAVLIDLAKGRLHVFFVEIWPQELYYLTGLLVLATLVLVLLNAVAGR